MQASLSLFLETICVEAYKPLHIEYHNQRLHRTQKEIFSCNKRVDLSTLINPPDAQRYRCRILYHQDIESIEYLAYEPKKIDTIRVIEHCLEYHYKYANRDQLNQLMQTHNDSDEVLIVCHGLITDTTIANIAFLERGRWITPKEPLLRGTTRQRLLDEGFLACKNIEVDKILHYDGVALMNAMVGFRIINPTWLGI